MLEFNIEFIILVKLNFRQKLNPNLTLPSKEKEIPLRIKFLNKSLVIMIVCDIHF